MNLQQSLQKLKTDIARKEAAFTSLYSLYPHLKKYSESQLLAYFELQTLEELYQHIQHIKKHDTPTYSHRSKDEYTVCSCTDGKGYPKYLYETEEAAQKEIDARMGQTKRKLTSYPCPRGYGWHLTKR